MSTPMRILNKLGPYIFTVVVVGVVVFVATLFFTWSTGLNAPNTAVEATTSPQPTETATHEAVAPPTPTSPAETNTAPVEAEPVGPDTATSIIDSIELIEDDIIITLTTSAEANATTTYAPYVLQVAMEELALDPELAAEIDLVAIYSSDGVMVASDRGGKWQ